MSKTISRPVSSPLWALRLPKLLRVAKMLPNIQPKRMVANSRPITKVASDAPVVTGAINQTLGSATGMQVFAGAREDPFFIDLEAFFRIIPDRKPVTGPLSQLPDAQSATSFRAAGQAVDAVRGKNVLSIVIELPKADLVAGGNAKIGVWGTISR